MNSPKISIVIPVYNVEQYIKRALESCINQTLNDIEIIVVVDDCGNDNSIAIAYDFAKLDSRIRIIHNERNLGTFNARIKGINQANGQYILFLDADDYITNDACNKAFNKAIESNNTPIKYTLDKLPDIVFFGMKFYPPTFKKVAPPILIEELLKDEILKASFAHCATPPWHIWAKLYKASHIKRVINLLLAHMGDFPRINMAEDALKSFAILALAQKSIGIKDKLYIYCNNEQSITRKIDIESTKKKIIDFDSVINYLDKFGQIAEIKANKNYEIAKNKTQNILKAQRELELRYLDKAEIHLMGGGSPKCDILNLLPQYLIAAIKSLKYHHKWQTYVRILAYLTTLGKIKL